MDVTGPKAKLKWAFAHLSRLEAGCQQFLEQKPFRVVPEFNEEAGCFELRYRTNEADSAIDLSLIAGDAIHNARSALDQAVWLIACRSNSLETLWEDGVAPNISFPVTHHLKRFEAHRVLPYIADDARDLLRSLQPFEGGDTPEALGELDRMWNIDKHRVLHKSVAQIDVSKVKFRPGAIRIDDLTEDSPDAEWHPLPAQLYDGVKIASVRFRNGRGPPETVVEVTHEPTPVLCFGGGYVALSVGSLAELAVHADHALSLIAQLPEKP